MDHLFVVRTGEHGPHRNLTQVGRATVGRLGKLIRKTGHTKGNGVSIVSSPRKDAITTARIIARHLRTTNVEEDRALYIAARGNQEVQDVIAARRAKVMVLVTHCDICKRFPKEYLEREFGTFAEIPELDNGTAVHFNLRLGTHSILRT
jgi:phosphohistidine phosphatase SixA